MFIRVDFPDPEGPQMATKSRAPTLKVTPPRASTLLGPMGYVRHTSSMTIIAPLLHPNLDSLGHSRHVRVHDDLVSLTQAFQDLGGRRVINKDLHGHETGPPIGDPVDPPL